MKSAVHHKVEQQRATCCLRASLQQEGAGRLKGGKLEGGGAFLAKQRELLEISTFLWKDSCSRGGATRGVINKVV